MKAKAMELFDSHAHLDFDAYAEDRDQVLQRAWDAGMTGMVTVGLGLEGAEAAVLLAHSDPRLRATVGVHPHDARLDIDCPGDPTAAVAPELHQRWEAQKDRVLGTLSAWLDDAKVVAVGEVGLDYHYDHSPRSLQRDLFRAFIQLAVAWHLPLVVHCREAESDTIDILRAEGAERVGGVIHCFSGDPALGRVALSLGFYLGLAGPLTFKKSEAFRRLVADLPMDRLLVETDCPFLSPEPHRGRRNEPAHVIEVVRTLAQIKSLSPAAVGSQTADNARRLFGIE